MMGISGGGGGTDDLADDSFTPLDPAAREAVQLFTRIMIRSGRDLDSVQLAFIEEIAKSRSCITPLSPSSLREIPEAPHLVTLWCATKHYVDKQGVPIPLPKRGARKSIETLARRISASLNVDELVAYLLQTDTIAETQGLFRLTRSFIMLRGISGSAHSRSIRGLLGVLRTLEHNLLSESDADGWFEFTVENPSFPVSKLDDLDKLARRECLSKLRKFDRFMRHCEETRDPSEPTVWVGIGMHRFQHEITGVFSSLTRPPSPRRPRSPGRSRS
jgi:hypothetical protein